MRDRKTILAAVCLSMLAFATMVAAQQRTISGTLTPTVEAGGWLIDAGSEKYLILNADKFSTESWFRSGTRVTATGELKRDAITIYQQGIPFEARTITPAASQPDSKKHTVVIVSGDARLYEQPDTATISISVVTQNTSALEAQQMNASRTATVITAVTRAAGTGAEIKTSGYSLVPQRVYKQNEPPTISGYEARNTISVIMSDLSKVGPVIDAAATAGANNIDGVSFSLRRDQDARGRALAEATRAARTKANTLAGVLGGRVVRIVTISESGTMPRPVIYAQQESFARASGAADTPIEPGTLEIISRVELTAEIENPS